MKSHANSFGPIICETSAASAWSLAELRRYSLIGQGGQFPHLDHQLSAPIRSGSSRMV